MAEIKKDCPEDGIYKIAMAIMMFATTTIIGLFIHASWATANAGIVKVVDLENRMTKQETILPVMQRDISEIKEILKSQIAHVPDKAG